MVQIAAGRSCGRPHQACPVLLLESVADASEVIERLLSGRLLGCFTAQECANYLANARAAARDRPDGAGEAVEALTRLCHHQRYVAYGNPLPVCLHLKM
jgi:hypothetical protein